MTEVRRNIRLSKHIVWHFLTMNAAMRGKRNEKAHCLAIAVKQVHAIEKGLAMKEIRWGFGLPRIHKMLDCVQTYLNLGGNVAVMECSMAYSVLNAYFDYHHTQGYTNPDFEATKSRFQALFAPHIALLSSNCGGVQKIVPGDIKPDEKAFEQCVLSRHSIRDFQNVPVPEEALRKALELAMHAPSACNRQSTRVYVLDRSKFSCIKNWTGGVKTFLDSVDKLLIITGQMSAYENDEYLQYAVSASIFAGYLSLSLHAVGLGSCLLQRSLICDGPWKEVAQTLGIPKDEQAVCAIAVGVPAENVVVPVSQRLEYERVVTIL